MMVLYRNYLWRCQLIYNPTTTRRQSQGSRQRERGQSLVELTISGMILIMLFMGIMDFGRVYFIYIALVDSAAEAALYTSLFPACPYPGASCPSGDNGYDRARDSARGFILWDDGRSNPSSTSVGNASVPQMGDSDATIASKNKDGDTALTIIVPKYYGTGSTVYVKLDHTVKLLTPIFPPMFGRDSIVLHITASQIILDE